MGGVLRLVSALALSGVWACGGIAGQGTDMEPDPIAAADAGPSESADAAPRPSRDPVQLRPGPCEILTFDTASGDLLRTDLRTYDGDLLVQRVVDTNGDGVVDEVEDRTYDGEGRIRLLERRNPANGVGLVVQLTEYDPVTGLAVSMNDARNVPAGTPPTYILRSSFEHNDEGLLSVTRRRRLADNVVDYVEGRDYDGAGHIIERRIDTGTVRDVNVLDSFSWVDDRNVLFERRDGRPDAATGSSPITLRYVYGYADGLNISGVDLDIGTTAEPVDGTPNQRQERSYDCFE